MNTLIEFGTNYGSTIEIGLLCAFVGMVATTVMVALKETK